MEFTRCYMKSEMLMHRGADANGKKKDSDKCWFNLEMGIVIRQVDGHDLSIYHMANLPDSFAVFLWRGEKEVQTYDEIMGRQKPMVEAKKPLVKKVVRKKKAVRK